MSTIANRILIAVLIVSVCLITACTKQDRPIRIGIATWAGFATGYIGNDQGFFNGVRIDNHVLDDSNARHAAFQSGDIDIMVSSADVFAQEVAHGISGSIILITDESLSDGIIVKSDINSITDLKGKKVGFAKGTPSEYFLAKMLDSVGLKIADVEAVTFDDPGRAGDAFMGGSLDAAVTWEPFLSQVVTAGKGNILVSTKDYPGIIVDVLVANAKFASNKNELDRFLRGWMQSVDFISRNPQRAAEIISKGLNTPLDDVKGMMQGLRYADSARNAYYFNDTNPNSTLLASILSDAGKYWKQLGLADSVVSPQGHVSQYSAEFFQGKK